MNDETDLDAELGFEPAVPARAEKLERGPRKRGRRGKLGRRLGSAAVLLGALASTAGAYAIFATSSGATDTATSAADVQRGKQLYEVSCIACHGANLQGVDGRGVSLIGVGQAATYFQVSTGRMPLAVQGAEADRKEAKFNEADTDALAAFVESMGGGPTLPTGSLRGPDSSIAAGGLLFRLNCASCHGTTLKGAPLSAGKYAPGLNDSSDKQIVAAMLTGPESMPVFSNNQLTVAQKRSIVAYVQTLKATADPGGNGIDRIGPVSEAIVIWVGGVGAIMAFILWIGAKSE